MSEKLMKLKVNVWRQVNKDQAGEMKGYVVENVAANGFRLLEIGVAHVGRVESLAQHHGDPFDRLLIAQALEEKLPVVTADPVFVKYGVKRIW